MKHITTKELMEIFLLLYKKLVSENELKIEIDTDLYRIIPTDEWDNYHQDIIVTGSLYDDIGCLKLLLKDADRPCTYVDFDRFASLLRAISQKNNPV